MVNGIRAIETGGLNKGRCSKIRGGSRDRQATHEEGRWTHRPKRYEYNIRDENPE